MPSVATVAFLFVKVRCQFVSRDGKQPSAETALFLVILQTIDRQSNASHDILNNVGSVRVLQAATTDKAVEHWSVVVEK